MFGLVFFTFCCVKECLKSVFFFFSLPFLCLFWILIIRGKLLMRIIKKKILYMYFLLLFLNVFYVCAYSLDSRKVKFVNYGTSFTINGVFKWLFHRKIIVFWKLLLLYCVITLFPFLFQNSYFYLFFFKLRKNFRFLSRFEKKKKKVSEW